VTQLSANNKLLSALDSHRGIQSPYKLCENGCGHVHILICVVFHRKFSF